MIVACGVILTPKAAMADVTTGDLSIDPVFNITIPSAAAWVMDTTTACTLSSDDFNFTGLAVAVPNSQTACTMGFGAVATPDSYLITNDPTVVGDNLVTLAPVSCTVGGAAADTTCGFTADRVFTVTHAVAPKENFNILAYKLSTDAVADNPEIGTADLTRVGLNLTKADAVAMTGDANNRYPIDLKLDVDESTLDELDAPAAIVVTMRFTIAGPTY